LLEESREMVGAHVHLGAELCEPELAVQIVLDVLRHASESARRHVADRPGGNGRHRGPVRNHGSQRFHFSVPIASRVASSGCRRVRRRHGGAQLLPKQQPGAVHPRFHGGDADAQDFGDLEVRQALDIAQEQRGTIVRR